MMGTPYLFDNAVLDRHARMANGLPVESELEFADRLVWLASFPASDVQGDDDLLDSFLDRKHVYAGERGGVRTGVAFIVALAAAAVFGWLHGSSAPNGATLLAVLIIGAVVAMFWTFGHRYRRREQVDAAYTKRMESRLRQDTTGDHIWDA